MKHTLGIRREDISKTAEKRVAITPEMAAILIQAGHRVILQPGIHPQTGEIKRTFPDEAYTAVQAEISESLEDARIIFGLKEIETDYLLPDKTYLFFSHTHKGQLKNRTLLKSLIAQRATLIDYELIVNPDGRRMLTAFTYFAGYAGMTDTLWALGQKWAAQGIHSPFELIPQAIEKEDLGHIRALYQQAGALIQAAGTPAACPPVIIGFMGNGKTSAGAQEMLDYLPVTSITPEDLPHIYAQGSRHTLYKLVLEIPQLYKPLSGSPLAGNPLPGSSFNQAYLQTPQYFESNLEQIFPYCTVLMNCVLWSDRFPRLLTRAATCRWYDSYKTLQVIGDITCDPEGAIQFSRETWIDNPVFTYYPADDRTLDGILPDGISVMAVTNLPCEFSADASVHFGREIQPLLMAIATADYDAQSPADAGLPTPAIQATILWQGAFTPPYTYMQAFVQEV